MKRLLILLPLIVLCLNLSAWAVIDDNRSLLDKTDSTAHTTMDGRDRVPAEFFRSYYHRSDLIYYLEALNDHTVVENMTIGQWWVPEPLTFAVDGNPNTSNRYYIDGMRVDDRFLPGSTQFVPNMQQYNLEIGIHNASLRFEQDSFAGNYIEVAYNFGRIGNGEPGLGTKEVFNITHRSPMESAEAYKHVTARRHQKGAGTLDAAYTFKTKAGTLRQHFYGVYGERQLTREDASGLITDDPYYRAPYYKVQADGCLTRNNHPTEPLQFGYRLNFSGRTDAGSEQLYNYAEVYDHKNYTGQLYYKQPRLTTGITWATNTIHHHDLNFSKNIIDQDGESFFPFIADGNTHELSWAVNYKQNLLSDHLSVYVDANNSMIHFRPTNEHFTNEIYFQQPADILNNIAAPAASKLYRYEWTSNAYTGGILENTIGLKAHYAPHRVVDLSAHVDFTLDGLALGNGKSKISPNWQAGVNVGLHPCHWFGMGLTVAHERIPYNINQLRYFSNDYMNANIYYAGTNTLFTTTGGKYHNYKKGLHQTSFLEVNIPIRFAFRDKRGGKHEIVLQNTYKKFFNVWYTRYLGNSTDYGHYEQQHGLEVFYLNPGVKQYEVGYTSGFGTNALMNSPYYLSQLTRYTYTGRKVLLSLSWQSMQEAGYVGLGNGVNSNTIGALSETTANPNTSVVLDNRNAQYPGVSRMDLDKGYECRFYLAYNICKWVQTGITVKWTDGKPFTAYTYCKNADQVAIFPNESRGTNPTDGNFGTRHAAWYMIDMHVQGSWTVSDMPMRLRLECYNMWDFCNDLAEMAFVQDIPYAHRASMIMNVPTGLLTTFTINL